MNTTSVQDPFADLATSTSAPQGSSPQPATDKQVAFLKRLMLERPAFCAERGRTIESIDAAPLSKRQASIFIDALLAQPKEQSTVRPDGSNASTPAPTLDEGIYKVGDTFYKVYLTRETRQRVVGKLIVTTIEDEAAEHGFRLLSAEWEYLGKSGLALLSPSDKCSHEDAAAFGHLYGVCCNCLAELNDHISVHHGYGPVCAARHGWPRLTPRQYAALIADAVK